MFKSRGYRGLNILPFPRHVRNQITQGYINRTTANQPMKSSVDYTNYEKFKNSTQRMKDI